MIDLSNQQLATIRAFLAQVRERAVVEDEEQVESRLRSASVGNWEDTGLDRIDILTALWWYQFRHKPGSREWRPGYILQALVGASERDYVELGKLEADENLIHATPQQKKQARMIFIRRFGFETYRDRIKPIMRRHGVKALFNAPATSEIRGYVEILAGLANKTL